MLYKGSKLLDSLARAAARDKGIELQRPEDYCMAIHSLANAIHRIPVSGFAKVMIAMLQFLGLERIVYKWVYRNLFEVQNIKPFQKMYTDFGIGIFPALIEELRILSNLQANLDIAEDLHTVLEKLEAHDPYMQAAIFTEILQAIVVKYDFRISPELRQPYEASPNWALKVAFPGFEELRISVLADDFFAQATAVGLLPAVDISEFFRVGLANVAELGKAHFDKNYAHWATPERGSPKFPNRIESKKVFDARRRELLAILEILREQSGYNGQYKVENIDWLLEEFRSKRLVRLIVDTCSDSLTADILAFNYDRSDFPSFYRGIPTAEDVVTAQSLIAALQHLALFVEKDPDVYLEEAMTVLWVFIDIMGNLYQLSSV